MAGLFDLPEKQTPPDPEHDAAVKDYHERRQELEEADGLKDGILRVLEQGTDPQIVLYTAVRAIGLYSGDTEFTRQAYKHLDAVYGDLAQESFIVDNAAIAAERLRLQGKEYRSKLAKQIRRQRGTAKRITAELEAILKSLEQIEQADELM